MPIDTPTDLDASSEEEQQSTIQGTSRYAPEKRGTRSEGVSSPPPDIKDVTQGQSNAWETAVGVGCLARWGTQSAPLSYQFAILWPGPAAYV